MRLLLMALMGVALASRLALGAVAPAQNEAQPHDALAKLQAATILCGERTGSKPAAPRHGSAPAGDFLLLADQSDNAHALTSEPALPGWVARALPMLRPLMAARMTPLPPWRKPIQARAPPPRS